MCDVVNEQIAASSLRHYVDARLISLGFVDDLALDALIANTSAILLPIEYGGGSHLKTAEALVSRRPIIGTTNSFRGFRHFQHLPQVTIADTPEQFEAAIQRALAATDRPDPDLPVPKEVLWEATLQPVVKLMRSMAV
jgi:hypothetical protein